MGVFTGGALEEPLVRRADLIIAFGLDTVELIPRRWPYTAPVLSLARGASSDPRVRAVGGGAYFTPALEVVGDLGHDPRGAGAAHHAPATSGGLGRGRGGPHAPRAARPRSRWRCPGWPRTGWSRSRASSPRRAPSPPWTRAPTCSRPRPTGTRSSRASCLISNGLATMGFALPAAIAAQLVHPDRRVVCFTGDGGLMMVAAELETVARLRLPIVIVVFNDAALSLIEVKQEQKGFAGASMRYAGPDLPRAGARLRHPRAGRRRTRRAPPRARRRAGRARARADRRAHRSLRLPADAGDRPRRRRRLT